MEHQLHHADIVAGHPAVLVKVVFAVMGFLKPFASRHHGDAEGMGALDVRVVVDFDGVKFLKPGKLCQFVHIFGPGAVAGLAAHKGVFGVARGVEHSRFAFAFLRNGNDHFVAVVLRQAVGDPVWVTWAVREQDQRRWRCCGIELRQEGFNDVSGFKIVEAIQVML